MNDNLPDELRRTFAAVRDHVAIPPLPDPAPIRQPNEPNGVRRRPGRRTAVAAAVVVGVSSLGLGTAAAVRLLPQLNFYPIAGTERLTVSSPAAAPGDTVQLYLADATTDPNTGEKPPVITGYCLSFVLDNGTVTPSNPGAGCGPSRTGDWDKFGANGVSSGRLFALRIGHATRVVLTQPDGTSQDLGIKDGWTVGQAQIRGNGPAPMLVAYDDEGRQIARKTLSYLPHRD
jgi:hypothetical protein